jgi:hypothetical protein
MRLQILVAYFIREVSARAAQFQDLPLPKAISKAVEELRPEIITSLSAAKLSSDEFCEAVQAFA